MHESQQTNIRISTNKCTNLNKQTYESQQINARILFRFVRLFVEIRTFVCWDSYVCLLKFVRLFVEIRSFVCWDSFQTYESQQTNVRICTNKRTNLYQQTYESLPTNVRISTNKCTILNKQTNESQQTNVQISTNKRTNLSFVCRDSYVCLLRFVLCW
jgi:hypothetical protein